MITFLSKNFVLTLLSKFYSSVMIVFLMGSASFPADLFDTWLRHFFPHLEVISI